MNSAPEIDPFFQTMMREEPLCAELVPHLCNGAIGQMIHHPLVISFLHDPKHSAMVNEQYRASAVRLESLLAAHQYESAIFAHERPYRFDALMEYIIDYDFHDWMAIRRVWIDSENIYQSLDDWRDVWSSDRGMRLHAMTSLERDALEKMPDRFTIYRGISHENDDQGMSWTIDRDKAEWFANRFKGTPRVLVGEVERDRVYAYLIGRGESEIVVDPDFVKIS